MRGFGVAALFASIALLPGLASAQEAARSGKPANVCTELTAFLHPPPPQPAAATPQTPTAVQAPSPNAAAPKPPAAGEPQQSSGLSGPVPNSGPGAAGPQGATQNTAAPSGAGAPQAAAPPAQAAAPAAPATPAAPPPKKPTPASIERADAAARSNDIAACQGVAREIRRAGVPMPAPLMALAAMDLKLLEAAK